MLSTFYFLSIHVKSSPFAKAVPVYRDFPFLSSLYYFPRHIRTKRAQRAKKLVSVLNIWQRSLALLKKFIESLVRLEFIIFIIYCNIFHRYLKITYLIRLLLFFNISVAYSIKWTIFLTNKQFLIIL